MALTQLLCGPRASQCGARAYAGRARSGLRVQFSGPPRVICAGLRVGPPGLAQIATPRLRESESERERRKNKKEKEKEKERESERRERKRKKRGKEKNRERKFRAKIQRDLSPLQILIVCSSINKVRGE